MTKEQLAQKLNGREYGGEITKAEEAEAKASGLVVVFGYSDDNVEFRGCIHDEVGCCDGGIILVTRKKLMRSDSGHKRECDCEWCGYVSFAERANKIEAVWSEEGGEFAWYFKTDIPHSTFDIYEDGEKFCRGIVFGWSEVQQ